MDGFVEVVRDFTRAIVDLYDRDALLDQLTRSTTDLFGAVGSGIMLEGRHGGLDFAAASGDAVVTEMERLQDRVRTGVCHDAFVSSSTIAVGDLEATDRWPTYRSKALSLGLRSVLGVPLYVGGRTIGVLNVYRRGPGPWHDDEVVAAEVLAGMGAAFILHAGQVTATRALAEQLQEALDSRSIIERAKGVLMAQHDITADDAFEWLRKLSMDQNVKVRDVARRVIEQRDLS